MRLWQLLRARHWTWAQQADDDYKKNRRVLARTLTLMNRNTLTKFKSIPEREESHLFLIMDGFGRNKMHIKLLT